MGPWTDELTIDGSMGRWDDELGDWGINGVMGYMVGSISWLNRSVDCWIEESVFGWGIDQLVDQLTNGLINAKTISEIEGSSIRAPSEVAPLSSYAVLISSLPSTEIPLNMPSFCLSKH